MKIKRPLCFLCLLFIVIVIATTKAGPPEISDSVIKQKGKTLVIKGKIKNRQEKNGTMQLLLKNMNSEDEIEGVVFYVDNYDKYEQYLQMGRILEIKGVFMPFSNPDNEGQFNQAAYYKMRGYDGTVKRGRIERISQDYNKIEEWLRSVREDITKVFEKYLTKDDAGIMGAMILGDKSELDSEIKEKYQNAGISHLLALSGLHIAAVGLAITKILGKTGISKIASNLIAGVIITLYAYMTGFSVSTKRALIMFVMASVASCIGRSYDLITAAAFSSIVMLVFNPYNIYDAGFLLSFLAIVGIGIVYPIINSAFIGIGVYIKSKSEGIYKILSGLSKSIGASFSITITTLPVSLYNYFQVSSFSIILNLIVIPLMSLVLLTGFVGGGVGLVEMYLLGEDSTVNCLERFIFGITHCILALYDYLCSVSGEIRGNIIVAGKPGTIQMIAYVIIVALALLSIYKSCINKGFSSKCRNKITYASIIALFASILIFRVRKFEKFEIRNISVGQGDCALLIGEELPVVMIDAGSSDIKQVAKYRIIPVLKSNGITKVDYCILTHLDMDHISGALEILNGTDKLIGIENIIISRACYDAEMTGKNPSDNFIKLLEAIQTSDSKLLIMDLGDEIDLGDVTMTCIYPSNNIITRSNENYSENDMSLVAQIEVYESNKKEHCIFRGLFTGDIGETAEKEMLCELKRGYSYLKVAHHGSKYSTSEEFIGKVRPSIAVISVGEDNSYGHPHKETIHKLEEIGAHIYRTDINGELLIKVNDERTEVTAVKE